MKTTISELMTRSGVAFGTSGARGLATAITDRVSYAYTVGFLQYLEKTRQIQGSKAHVALAGDLRPSTGRIMEAVTRAIEDKDHLPVHCGRIPSPALALFGLVEQIATIMVTGSHIPDDRNGIKFNKPTGEILKSDERGMAAQEVDLPDHLFDADGRFTRESNSMRIVNARALSNYTERYRDFFGRDALRGLRVGVYQHSAVGRDMLVEILTEAGATTLTLGRSDVFIPVDTEAIRPEDVQLAKEWAQQHQLDAIVSADGDSDRPLVSDETGGWLRGDVAGILCANFLEADCVCTPVSCNTAVEKCGWFKQVRRTRIGSPYVIEAMNQAAATGAKRVVGYEANGGFLINSDIELGGRKLRALPTRDAVIVILSILTLARQKNQSVRALAGSLPQRFTASDRLKNFPTEKSTAILARFKSGSDETDRRAIESVFAGLCGQVTGVDRTDGQRFTFKNAEVIHLRPSGNAPEFRCYSEAATDERAKVINSQALKIVSSLAEERQKR
jgi:phosphomannomutase